MAENTSFLEVLEIFSFPETNKSVVKIGVVSVSQFQYTCGWKKAQ